jgi:hypothetical protein
MTKGESQPINPYSAPHESSATNPTSRTYGFAFWRAYLAVHLVAVIATAVFVSSGEGRFLPVQFASVVELGVALGIPLIPAGPFVAIYLLVAGRKSDRRYFVAAAAEALLWATHFFAAQPLVQ